MKPLPLTDTQLFEVTKMVSSGRLRGELVDIDKATRFILQATEAMAELSSMKIAHMKHDAAYNAGHDVGEALFAAYGYRAGNGDGQHIALGQFMEIIFGSSSAAQAANDFDSLRQTRNSVRYRGLPLSSSEADFAEKVVNSLLIQALAFLPTS